MCLNAQTSLLTWGMAVMVAVYARNQNSMSAYWVANLVLMFTTIQLLEGLIWLNYNNTRLKSILTKLILVALLAQPVVQWYMAYKTHNTQFTKYMTWLYIAILAGVILYVLGNNGQWTSTRGQSGHLVWQQDGKTLFENKSLLGWLYVLGLLLPMLWMPNNVRWLTLILALGTCFWSYNNYVKTGEFSSMWCFSAALLSFVVIIPKNI